MRVVIWGAGQNAIYLINILGVDKVAAFVDINSNLHNTDYLGVPVVDLERYIECYSKCPIIISPAGYEEEIKMELEERGIYWAFPFLENKLVLDNFFLQISEGGLIKKYKKHKSIYIYGCNILSLLLYDFCQSANIDCKLLYESDAEKRLEHFVEKQLNFATDSIRELDEKEIHVVLTCKLSRGDKEILKEKGCVVEDFCVFKNQEIDYNPQLEKFKNIHQGKRCFIVATGPSLKVEDLDVLYKNQEICISVNGIFKIFSETLWRPNYYTISDRKAVLIWRKDILSMDVQGKFISDYAWIFLDEEKTENMYKWHLEIEEDEGKEPKFSSDFARKSYWGSTVVYDCSLQLAAYMGFDEIYLLGADCCNYEDSKKQHFVENYHNLVLGLDIDVVTRSYQAAKKYADEHGIKIYNATRGGMLEVFERVDYDSLF